MELEKFIQSFQNTNESFGIYWGYKQFYTKVFQGEKSIRRMKYYSQENYRRYELQTITFRILPKFEENVKWDVYFRKNGNLFLLGTNTPLTTQDLVCRFWVRELLRKKCLYLPKEIIEMFFEYL